MLVCHLHGKSERVGGKKNETKAENPISIRNTARGKAYFLIPKQPHTQTKKRNHDNEYVYKATDTVEQHVHAYTETFEKLDYGFTTEA